jgi:hypothetical protein
MATVILYGRTETRILPMSVQVDVTREDEHGWWGYMNGETAFFSREKWTREEPPATRPPARANPTERPALLEIVAALTKATERADLPGMARASTLLAAHTGEVMAALVMCVPTIRLALDPRMPISVAEHAQAQHAARAILNLTGIDPAKEG